MRGEVGQSGQQSGGLSEDHVVSWLILYITWPVPVSDCSAHLLAWLSGFCGYNIFRIDYTVTLPPPPSPALILNIEKYSLDVFTRSPAVASLGAVRT